MDALAAITLGLHLVTGHFGSHDLQPIDPGLYMRLDAGNLAGLTTGFYRNSYDRTSAYLAWTFQTPDQRLALTVGAVTGYPAKNVMPMVVPSVRLPISDTSAVRLAYIPRPVKHGTAAGLHLSVERSF